MFIPVRTYSSLFMFINWNNSRSNPYWNYNLERNWNIHEYGAYMYSCSWNFRKVTCIHVHFDHSIWTHVVSLAGTFWNVLLWRHCTLFWWIFCLLCHIYMAWDVNLWNKVLFCSVLETFISIVHLSWLVSLHLHLFGLTQATENTIINLLKCFSLRNLYEIYWNLYFLCHTGAKQTNPEQCLNY